MKHLHVREPAQTSAPDGCTCTPGEYHTLEAVDLTCGYRGKPVLEHARLCKTLASS